MIATAPSQAKRRSWRDGARRAALALLALALFPLAGGGVLAPWYEPARPRALPTRGLGCEADVALEASRQPQCRRSNGAFAKANAIGKPAQAGGPRWRAAQLGAYVVFLLIGGLAALAWRPREHALVLQYLLLAAGAGAALAAWLSPALLPFVLAPALLALLLDPAPRAALRLGQATPSLPLLALGLLAAGLLAAQARAADAGSAGGLLLDMALALAGLLAATRRPGWAALGLMAGAALIYLGLAAALLADQSGAWGGGASLLATVGGWAFVGATYWELRRAGSSARPMRFDRSGV